MGNSIIIEFSNYSLLIQLTTCNNEIPLICQLYDPFGVDNVPLVALLQTFDASGIIEILLNSNQIE